MNTILKNTRPVNRLWFDDLFTREFDRFLTPVKNTETSLSPSANVWEDEKNLFFEFALPGISKEQIAVKVENGVLSVTAKHETTGQKEEKQFIRREFGRASYSREFRINEKRFQLNAVAAKIENGILNLTIPKVVEEKKESVHTIEVK